MQKVIHFLLEKNCLTTKIVLRLKKNKNKRLQKKMQNHTISIVSHNFHSSIVIQFPLTFSVYGVQTGLLIIVIYQISILVHSILVDQYIFLFLTQHLWSQKNCIT